MSLFRAEHFIEYYPRHVRGASGRGQRGLQIRASGDINLTDCANARPFLIT